METAITVACISGVISSIALLSNLVQARARERHEERIAGLKSRLEEKLAKVEAQLTDSNSERNARRDYEYEARKRLYAEVEPVLFQLVELSEAALHRIYSLARTARHGNLSNPQTSWLESPDGYYFKSSLYNLIAPLAAVKLLQRRITFVDLSVEKTIAAEYSLAKKLLITFTDDFDFARLATPLKYDPNADALDNPEGKALVRQCPEKYWRQGVFIGVLEGCAEALLTESSEGRPARVRSFSEVDAECRKQGSPLQQAFREVRYLLKSFHPARRPVLWRILIAQACIYRTFVELREAKLAGRVPSPKPLRLINESERGPLDWRSQPGEALDDDVFKTPFVAAAQYFQKRAPELFDRT